MRITEYLIFLLQIWANFLVTKLIFITVEWQEFHQEVESNCTAIQVAQPYQKVSHKKKCLLSNPTGFEELDTEVLQDLKPGDKIEKIANLLLEEEMTDDI